MFAKRLKELRNELNMTQKELGDKLNVLARTIGYYESNQRFPNEETLNKIANIFNVSTDYLLGRTDMKEMVIMEGDEIPKELKKVGIDYLEVNKIAKEKGFTPQDIKDLIETIERIKNNNQ